MRAVVQRVTSAGVEVLEGEAWTALGSIGEGLVVLLGVAAEDGEREVAWLAEKVANLRIFGDESGRMQRSLLDVGGGALVVSQFTLLGDSRRGRRPSFVGAARPERALPLYEAFCEELSALGVRPVERGRFGGHMRVSLANDGPVTLVVDTP